MWFREALAPEQDPLQIEAFLIGDEAVFTYANGNTLLVVHGDDEGKLSWPDKYIELFAPNVIVCCYPLRARYTNPRWASIIFGDWDEPTTFCMAQGLASVVVGPESQLTPYIQ
jgi:hypothetical protein